MVMAVLMLAATLGTVAVSAATDNSDFAVYFENEKNWNQVYAYVYTKDGEENAPWPGVKLDKVGTTTLIDKVLYPNDTKHDIYEFECEKTTDEIYVIFNEGIAHGQQASAIHMGKFFGNIHLVGLDKDNNATIGHYVDEKYIQLTDDKNQG